MSVQHTYDERASLSFAARSALAPHLGHRACPCTGHLPLGNQNWAPGPGPHAVLLCNLHLGEIDATVDLGLESHTLAVLEFLKQGFLVGFGACVFGFYWAGLFNGVCKAGCGALGPPRFCTIWPNQTPHCILVDATAFLSEQPDEIKLLALFNNYN